MTAPTAEEFARWRDDRVTQWIFAAIERGEEQNKQAWMDASWGQGVAAPEFLRELRTRADAYRALIDTDYAGWCEINGIEAVYDEG